MTCIYTMFLLSIVSCEKQAEATEIMECIDIKMKRSYLFFEKGFQGDELDVFVNGHHFENRILDTDPSMDLAGEIFIKTDTVQQIAFKINNQYYGGFCPYPFIQINRLNDQIVIKVAEEPTAYE